MKTYFKYTCDHLDYLSKRDSKLKAYIDKYGFIERVIITDLYQAIINSIIGQQISTKAHLSIWNKFCDSFKPITPTNIIKYDDEVIQKVGLSFRKVSYIKDITTKIVNKDIDLDYLITLDDNDFINELVKFKGIGKWTAEMMLIFCLNRMDVLAFDDLAIIRGIKKVYCKEEVTKDFFNELKDRYHPYASVASLYLWKASIE